MRCVCRGVAKFVKHMLPIVIILVIICIQWRFHDVCLLFCLRGFCTMPYGVSNTVGMRCLSMHRPL